MPSVECHSSSSGVPCSAATAVNTEQNVATKPKKKETKNGLKKYAATAGLSLCLQHLLFRWWA